MKRIAAVATSALCLAVYSHQPSKAQTLQQSPDRLAQQQFQANGQPGALSRERPQQQAAGQSQIRAPQQSGQRQSARLSASIPVVSAANLVGRPVVDRNGDDAGRVYSVVIDTRTGYVEYLLIEGRGQFNLNNELAALPWPELQQPQKNRPLVIDASAQQLANSPLIPQDRAYQLLQREWRTRVYGYYGYPYPYYGFGRAPGYFAPYHGAYAGNGNGAPAFNRGANGYGQNGQNGTYGRNGQGGRNYGQANGNGQNQYRGGQQGSGQYQPRQQANNRGTNRGNFGNGMNGGNFGGQNNQNNAQGQPSAQQGSAQQGNGRLNLTPAERRNALSVGRNGVLSVLASPTSVSAKGLRSMDVFTQSGEDIGSIDQVMIDTTTGHIAYLLLRAGGFLGLNPVWYPLPVEAIRIAPNGLNGVNGGAFPAGFRLVVNPQDLNDIPGIPINQANLTTRTPRRDLAQLYRHFGLTPYWERGSRTARSSLSHTTGENPGEASRMGGQGNESNQ